MQRLQVMFMSMGEPLLNLNNVLSAIERMRRTLPKAEMLISTSAPDVSYRELIVSATEDSRIGLQFSIHASTDEERDKIIPFKKKRTLDGIVHLGDKFMSSTGRRPFFNYCATQENATDGDADRLLALFNPRIWNATVSVVCEKNQGFSRRSEEQRSFADEFSQKLLSRGYNVRVFDPAGQDDIGGGCGQLWYAQEWLKSRKE